MGSSRCRGGETTREQQEKERAPLAPIPTIQRAWYCTTIAYNMHTYMRETFHQEVRDKHHSSRQICNFLLLPAVV
jgi:hypothetical protein